MSLESRPRLLAHNSKRMTHNFTADGNEYRILVWRRITG